MMRTKLVGAALAVALALPAAAQELRIGMKAQVDGADPHQLYTPNRNVQLHVYEPLAWQDERLHPVPRLAASWRVVDPLTWEFRLREGVTFQDGSPLTAEDVIFSIRRAQQIEGARTYRVYVRDIMAMEADGPHLVRIRTRTPAPTLPSLLTGFGTSSARAAADTRFYSREEIQLIVEEAHRDGRPVAVHAHGGPAIAWCVEAGVDTIEHGKLCTRQDFGLMRKAGTWLVSNHAISFHPEGIEGGDGGNPRIMEKLAIARRRSPETFGFALDSGVRWALGTDSMHGLLWFEAQKAVEFGATTEQAFAGVTRNAAEAIRMLDKVGTLEPGKCADIVSLRGDPLKDIAALREVGLIMKDGTRYDTLSSQ